MGFSLGSTKYIQSIGGLVVKSIVARKRQSFSTLDGPRVRFTVDALLFVNEIVNVIVGVVVWCCGGGGG